MAIRALESELSCHLLITPKFKPAGVSFILAWLANDCPERGPFDHFYRATQITDQARQMRECTKALRMIYWALDLAPAAG